MLDNWDDDIQGCGMFKVVNKMRMLKRHLKNLAWKDGNVFEKVTKLRDKLKSVQQKIDSDPDQKDLRVEESVILKEYADTVKVEEKMLFQKAKVKWLSVGDRNNSFFHKVLKSRNHKSRINSIYDEVGNCYAGKEVA